MLLTIIVYVAAEFEILQEIKVQTKGRCELRNVRDFLTIYIKDLPFIVTARRTPFVRPEICINPLGILVSSQKAISEIGAKASGSLQLNTLMLGLANISVALPV